MTTEQAKSEFWARGNGIFVNMFHRMDHSLQATKILDDGTVFDKFIDRILNERYKDGWRDRAQQSDLEHTELKQNGVKTMNDEPLTFDEWDEKYEAILELDEETQTESDILFFETYEPYIGDLKEFADTLAKESNSRRYQHIWTRIDGDNGKLILLNGWHICNRIDYCVSKHPWGDGTDADKDVYIEVKFEN